jgi:hypothetical protein
MDTIQNVEPASAVEYATTTTTVGTCPTCISGTDPLISKTDVAILQDLD